MQQTSPATKWVPGIRLRLPGIDANGLACGTISFAPETSYFWLKFILSIFQRRFSDLQSALLSYVRQGSGIIMANACADHGPIAFLLHICRISQLVIGLLLSACHSFFCQLECDLSHNAPSPGEPGHTPLLNLQKES